MSLPDRLVAAVRQGRTVLFLGAGANYHCNMSTNEPMPMADRVSELLSTKFGVRQAGLAETAELVEASYSRSQLNNYIVELFTGAKPSVGFQLISSFRWNSIFTTNYDLLVEDTYKRAGALQNLKVYYTSNQYVDLGPNDIAYYKLHGCISRADTTEGRLVITPDDYADFLRNRFRLFNRLADQLSDCPFLYLGYGRQDPNFRSIMADVQREMQGTLPEGFALFPGKTDEDDLVWRKKNVTLLDMDVDDFLRELDMLVPLRSNPPLPQFQFPILKQFQPLGSNLLSEVLSYFSLPVANFGATCGPIDFYKGSEADWIDINECVDAKRDLYDPIMNDLLEDAVSIDNHTTTYSILAEAGSGKSTLLRRMAHDLCHDLDQTVFWYRGERRVTFDLIRDIYSVTRRRVFMFVDRASRLLGNLESIRRDCSAAQVPLTIVITDRANEWNYAGGGAFRLTKQWMLGKLSDQEIERIVERLEKFGCLGNLKDLTIGERLRRFQEYSDRQLLVALRETTEGKDFDELIIEEADSIPDAVARRAYLHVCFMHAFGSGIRPSPLARSLGLDLAGLGDILRTLQGLVDIKDETYTARHAIIARVVMFSVGIEARIDLVEDLIRHLDLGYSSDNHTYRTLMTNEEFIDSIGGIDVRRRLFEALRAVNPNDWYIDQHEARMEFRAIDTGGSFERAERLIKRAIRNSDGSVVIRHTAGQLYVNRAYHSTGMEKRANFLKAINEFNELTKRAPGSDYVWTSLIESRVAFGATSDDDQSKYAEYGRAENDYQRALEICGATPYLLRAKGRLEAAWGHGEAAREYYKRAISGAAPPAGLLANYIKWELRHGGVDSAREASRRAVEVYASNAELLVLRAKSLILGHQWELSEVLSNLTNAERVSTGYIRMEAFYWHGVAYWECGRFTEAITHFRQCRDIAMSIDRADIKNVRYISGINQGEPKVYGGSIVESGPRSTWLLCNPGGARVFVSPRHLSRINGTSVKTHIGFNRLGPIALISEEPFEFERVI